MGRKIVLCFDGTHNECAAVNISAAKIFAMLDRTHDEQLSCHQPGSRTFARPGVWGKIRKAIVTRLDLAMAWLLEDHVCDGYRYPMRYHHPGDEIFVFGFSCGACTASTLAGKRSRVKPIDQ